MTTYIIYLRYPYGGGPFSIDDLFVGDINEILTPSGLGHFYVDAGSEEEAKDKIWEFINRANDEQTTYLNKVADLRRQYDIKDRRYGE